MSHTHKGEGRTLRGKGEEGRTGARQRLRARPGWGALVAVACAASLTACGGSGGAEAAADGTGSAAGASPATTAPAESAAPSEPTGTPPTSGAPPSQDPGGDAPQSPTPPTERPGAVGRCEASGLALALEADGQEMNSKYFDLRLTNTGAEPCDLVGHPGVSLLDADGKRVGEPATRSNDGAGGGGPVRLKPGQAAHATVKTAGEGVTDGACWPEAAALLVYPPGSKQTVTTRSLGGLRVCGDSFQVGPVGDRAP
ncbi:DUF4232 domain-containing protein [Streptomyces sp. NPDC058374]|uniref:DUF4232 domain-containing protein n=1 Tax=unclassified Streptomyces TaxID=2593676 RepID=UPI0036464C1F